MEICIGLVFIALVGVRMATVTGHYRIGLCFTAVGHSAAVMLIMLALGIGNTP